MSTEHHDQIEEAVAIIGLAARMPGARNAEEYWNNLTNGVESITFFSDEELAAMGVPAATLKDPNYVKGRGILPIPAEDFDAAFFGYNPREAEIIDPQQRWFLETAWEALENAGYSPDTYKGRIGTFAGAGGSQYLYNLQNNPDVGKFANRLSLATSNEKDYVATRVSYKMNLRGPSLTVQTACSTSLVATTLACTSLLNYQSDMAIAGGVSIRVPQGGGYMYQEGGIMSPDGHCRTFDAKAQGTTFSAGVGAVVLKRLSDAVADGDHIYAVIRGAAINNDGNAKAGYTAPGVDGQAEVAAEALALAGIEPETVQYIETHGTATNIGDPIEIAALTRAYAAGTTKKGFCAVGSVKSNIGHTDAAAGVAGLIKTVLALKNQKLVPSLFFETPNPHIDFENSPFYVNTELRDWKRNGTPRRAAVSSFGIGGTNAHVVLEEAPESEASGPSRDRQLILLSARTETALDTLTANLADWLKKNEQANFADVAFTLKAGRRAQTHRRLLVCRDAADAIAALEARDPKRIASARADAQHRSPAFLFPGQGAQYGGMAKGLYDSEPLFREIVDRCAEVLQPHLGLDIRTVLFDEQNGDEQLKQTWLTQPALFVTEYALARLWMQWGVVPEAMIGHSIGEYTAACLSGVLSLDDALALVAARGGLIQKLPAGSMMAVPVDESQLLPLLPDDVSLAAVNAPGLCVVSGTDEAITRFEATLAAQKLSGRRLHTSHAFHSMMMEPILDAFRAVLRKVRFHAPAIPYVSNVTGTWITEAEATDPEYYVRHLRGTVRFAAGMAELLREPSRVFLEVGPGRTLTTFVRQQPEGKNVPMAASLRHPQEATGDLDFILGSLGRLWLDGTSVDWDGFYKNENRHRIPVPTYPFERQRYWIAPNRSAAPQPAESNDKIANVTEWFSMPSWKRTAAPAPATADGRRWLVFSDDVVGDEAAAALRNRGEDVVVVNRGPVFAKMDSTAYVMRYDHRDDYTTIFEALAADAKLPTNIIHCGNVTTAPRSLDESTEAGFYGLIYLAQALAAKNLSDEVRIDVVANELFEVIDGERIDPLKATMLGPCKVIPQELPNVTVRTIDVRLDEMWRGLQPADVGRLQPADKGGLKPAPHAAARQIVTEALSAATDRAVAWRGKYRWSQAYENVRLESAGATPRLRDEGVYFITGGFGGIGLVLAEHLAQTCKARLALTARGALPAREEWQQWLDTHAEEDAISARIRSVQKLESLGATVLPLAADASNRAQMEAAVGEAVRVFGRIDGVVHAAGVAGGGIIPLKTREAAARVLDPKTKGTLILDELLQGQQLDFFILCSSLTAVVGAVGQVDYCAANAFMDAFAHRRSQEHPETLTVS
ncbi:MAG TPA: type I polyketide synthase, partial [Thermoanaerobaculia bacterium]|nr:type I polyketide synthase [Thermoanaerobaculia bacterium]